SRSDRGRGRHDRRRDAGSVRAADGELRARGRRELPEGLLPGPGDRRPHAVSRDPQAPHGGRARRGRRPARARRQRLQRGLRRAVRRHRGERGQRARRRLRPPRGGADREPRSRGPALEIPRRTAALDPEAPAARERLVSKPGSTPVAALVLLIVTWGYSWIAMKIALRYANPFDFAALRVAIGALFLFALVAARRQRLTLATYRMAFVLGMLQVGLFVALSQMALTVAEP